MSTDSILSNRIKYCSNLLSLEIKSDFIRVITVTGILTNSIKYAKLSYTLVTVVLL